MKIKVENQEKFIKRAFFLAWQAIGHTTGMGAFQDHPSATEQEVWKHVFAPGTSEIYGDYVFGRMMKWGVKVKDDIITAADFDFRPDYQGVSPTYKDNKALFDATAKSLNCEYETIE